MVKRNIFVEKEIACPYCKSTVPLRYPNPRLYVAATREADLHVVLYNWAEGIETETVPHYYAVWQCPKCLFADITEDVESPKGTMKDIHLREAYKGIGTDKKIVLINLRQLVAKGELTFDAAAALHAAALLIAGLPKKEDIDHNKLGRIALRLGWLFRERVREREGADTGPVGVFGHLSSRVGRLEQCYFEMAGALADLRLAALDSGAENGSEESEGDNPFVSVVDSMGDKLGELQTLLTMLQRTADRGRGGQRPPSAAASEGEETDLDGLLRSLKVRWAELPLNEEQCIRIAVDALDYSYSNEHSFQSIEQSMTVVSLIVELLIRIADHERALDYISQIYKGGLASKSDLNRRIQEGRKKKTMTPHDEKMLRRKIGTINYAIAQAGEKRRQLLDVITGKHRPTIDRVLEKMPESGVEEQEEALLKAGVPENIVHDLKTRKVIRDDKKKRGLFGR